ncbi:MAG: cell surface protein SprA [Bacteroidota bacterium]|nr:cell surface protein SprA [Bacteroidota bacterium]
MKRPLSILLFLLFSLAGAFSIFSAASPQTEVNMAAGQQDSALAEAKRPVHPVSKTIPETMEDLTESKTGDLKNPSNIESKVEYDPETGLYSLVTYLGDTKIGTPINLTQQEYLKYQQQQSSAAYWKEKNKVDYTKKGQDFSLTDMQFDLGLGDKIFGEGGVRLKTQGSIETKFGLKTNKVDNPSLSETARNKTMFNFDPQIQMSVNGKVGDKIDVNMNYDTQATFNYDAKSVKLHYDGKEDDIIKSIEAGNVSMPLNSSLITGGSSLFGVKTELQFGKLSVATVVSQQNSQTKSVSLEGGAQSRKFDLAVDNYDENRHFFLSHYFRDHYDTWMSKLPYVSSGMTVTKVEVWVTNKTSTLDNARNIVAFADLAEPAYISNSHWTSTGTYPSNGSNSLYSEITNQYAGARTFSDVNSTLSPIGLAVGEDYERLESARRLDASEYTLNSTLGYISLKQALNSDEILAVAYEYSKGGQTYQVGEFSTDGIQAPQTLFLKLLKGTNCSPSAPTWDLMMKNVYTLGDAYNLQSDGFKLNVVYQSDSVGTDMTYLTEGKIKNTLLLKVMGLDRLNSKQQAYPDGLFDFVEGYTVQSTYGRIIFPVLEPFGSHLRQAIGDDALADKYVFEELYDSTLTVAQQLSEKNKFRITGEYKASSGATISLGATNVAQGSVTVTAGGQKLTENVDYTVDYISGTVTITNSDLITSGTAINATCEDQSTYSMVRKTMTGLALNYKFNDNFSLGGTMMHLSETPLTTKVDMGYESVSNTIFGVNTSFKTESQLLTNLVDKLPLIEATKPSSLTVSAEYAKLVAGTSSELKNVSYVDDFESAKKTYNLKDMTQWFLASTPYDPSGGLFPEAAKSNDLAYGYNRALLAWYSIDGTLNYNNSSQTPSHLRNDVDQLSNHYVRVVNEKEIFPDRDIAFNQVGILPVMNLAFYPKQRGPYNYDVDGMQADGTLSHPEKRWGGIMRKIESGYTNFESNNVEYIEFWLMDPFVYDSTDVATGGDLYFDLGEISEDVLKDGKRSFENGLPTNASDASLVSETAWGKVSSKSSTAYSFDNTAGVRVKQDVGLDGLSDEEEATWPGVSDYVKGVKAKLNPTALEEMTDDKFSPLNDPAGDDYHYFRGSDFDSKKTDILDRYKHYNGTEGNSLPPEYTNETYSTAATTLPNVEDINLDFTLNESERYYQYRVSLRPSDTIVGQNFINDKRVATVTLKNGKTAKVKWYQFKVPITDYEKKVGTINGFSSIRFMRLFLTGFQDSVILRFGTLELVRGDWRSYTKDLYTAGSVPISDATMDVSTVSLEENSGRSPINYKLPPGVEQETDPSQPGVYLEDEQSLALRVNNLSPNDARAIYKNTSYDFRQYKRIQLFVHAEALQNDLNPPKNYETTVFIRLGSDNQSNYYEYEVPLEISPFYVNTARSIWPENNYLDIPFDLFTKLKTKRNAVSGGNYTTEYSEYDPDNEQNKVKIKGNPTLSDVETIMIGIRNKSGTVKSLEIWADELRLSGFKDNGGWAALGSAVLNVSDLGTVTASGKYITDGFGGLEESVSQRRQDTYSQYNISFNTDLGRLFPEKAKVNFPFYYSISKERTLPKYDPLNEDLLLKDVLKSTKSKAVRDSILNYSQTLKTYKSMNFSNVRINLKSKTPMPFDPANFSFNYNSTESDEHDPTTEYEITQNYQGGVNYNYASPLKPWQPFANDKKMTSSWLKLLKELNLNFLPNSVTASSKLTRYYYELQSRNLSTTSAEELATPLTVSKNFLWNSDLVVNWNLTKNLKLNASVNNQAEVEETRYAPVNKALYATEYENWKDTVSRSLRSFGTPLNYSQTVNLTWQVPLNRLPAFDFLTLNSQYNAVYNWERSTTSGTDNDLGNQISNQRTMSMTASANMTTLYNKSAFLKKILAQANKPTPQRPVTTKKTEKQTAGKKAPDDKSVKPQDKKTPGAVPATPVKTSRKFEKEVNLFADSAILIKHGLKNKRVFAVAVDSAGKKVQLDYHIKDENSLAVKGPKDGTVKITVLQKPELEEEDWYKPVSFIARTLMSVRNVSVIYKQSDGLTIPGFKPETGLISQTDYGTAPGWDYALGFQGSDYLQKALDKNWLVLDTVMTPAYMTKNTDLRVKASLEILPSLKIEFNGARAWNFNTEIQYMYDGMPETRTGNFTMTTIALSTAFESSKASNGYRSKAFETFLANRSMIASRLEEKMAGKLYPSTGFLKDTPLAGSVYNKSNGAFDLNSADVLIPAFLAAYSGKDARTSSLDLFPGLLSMLPNWSISYDGLSKLEFIRKYFKSVTLNHNYTCTYGVSSFSTYSTWQNAGDGLGFVRDVLTNSAVPSSMYDISAVTLTESFNPLLRIQGTLNSGLTLNTEITKTRALSLSISGGQIIETDQNQIGAGTGYKLSDFHPWGFMKGSKVKNDLNLTGNLKYKDMHALLRKIEGDYTQASSGNKTFVVELSGDYTMSKNMNLVLFYDLESSVPLVSSYPVRSSDFGVSIRFSLTR